MNPQKVEKRLSCHSRQAQGGPESGIFILSHFFTGSSIILFALFFLHGVKCE